MAGSGLAVDGVVPLLDADGARAADAVAEAAGVPRAALMARAAGHLARTAVAVGGRAYGLHVDVHVGPGDNGGDGWAAAPLLAAAGARVRVVVAPGVGAPRSPAAAAARAAWAASGGRTVDGPAGSTGSVRPDRAPDVVLDCLVGTGGTGPLRGGVRAAADAIAHARRDGARVVACDVPTGVDAATGVSADGAVRADATVTFGAPRRGLVLHPGASHAGVVHVARLGPAHPVDPTDGGWGVLDGDGARPLPLATDAEKRRRGMVVIVAGRVGASGAAALAARGALGAGAGLVRVLVPDPVRAEVAAHHPAAMVVGLPADADGALHADAVHALGPHLADADAVVAGPGLGVGAGAAAVVAALLAGGAPLVLDADGLNVLRADPTALAGRAATLVLTPHGRELVRLGVDPDAPRARSVPALAAALGAVVVAKGPGTLVAGPGGHVLVEPPGAPALATGGTGDVLAGMVGAVLAGAVAGAPDDPAAAGTVGARHREVLVPIARAVRWHAVAGRLAGAGGAGRTDAAAVASAVQAALAVCAVAVPPPDPGPAGRVALPALLGMAA